MAEDHAQQTAGVLAEITGRDTERRGDKEGQHERDDEDDGEPGKK